MRRFVISLAMAASVSAASANNSCPSITVTAPVRSVNFSGTAATIAATLNPRAANTSVELTGFSVSGSFPGSAQDATLTISGITGGTLTYYVNGITGGNGITHFEHSEEFTCPLTGLLNDGVTATLSWTGQFTNATINLHGF